MRLAALLLALALLIAPAGASAAISLSSIRNGLIEFALDQINSPGSFEITVEEIEDAEEGVTSLVGVKVSDGEGVWLTVERVNFSWSSRALLSGELSITRLELIGVDVTRPPSAEAEAPELKEVESDRGIFDWPRAPIALSVEGVRLERVSIAEGVLPQAIRFDAEGRAFDKGDLQELELAVRRTDEVAGSIDLLMRRDFAADTLRLDIDADEAAGGMVAAAAGLPDDAPATLTLNAEGPPEDWRLDLDAAVERVFRADGQATLNYAERLALNLDFEIVPGPELPGEARTVLGERARLVARVVEQEDGMIEVVEGALTSPALELTATGQLATGRGRSDLTVSMTALAPLAELADGVAFERVTFDGTVTGPQGELVAEGALGVSGLATTPADAGRLALDGRVRQTADGFAFELDGEGERLRIDRIGPEVIGTARLGATGALAGETLTLRRAALESPAIRATAMGDYDLGASSGTLTATLEAPEIAPIAGAYGVDAAGVVAATAAARIAGEEVEADIDLSLSRFSTDRAAAEELRLTGTIGVAGENVDFDLTGAGRRLVLDQIPRDLTETLDLVARGRLEGGTLELAALRLDSPLLTAEASGGVELDEATLGLDYRLETAELAPVAAAYGVEASGGLTATGRAEGAFEAPRLAGDVRLGGAGYQGVDYGDLDLAHDVTVGAAQEGEITLVKRGGAYGDAEVSTRFRLAGSVLTLEELSGRALGATVSGAAEADLERTLVDGEVALVTEDLAPIGELAGLPLSGAADVSTRFRLAGAALTLEGLSAKALGATVSGAAELDLERTLVDGTLAFDVADLAPVGQLAGLPLSGAATGTATLTTAEGAQNVAATVALTGFATEGVGVSRADIELSATDVMGDLAIDVAAKASGVEAGGVSLAALQATAAGPRSAIEFAADAQGRLGERLLTAAAKGRADASGDPILVTLASARATLGEDEVSLRRPLALRIGGGAVEAEGLDLALPGGATLAGDAAQRPGGFSGDLRLRGLDLALLKRWADAPVAAGTLDASATFDTRPGSAAATATATARGVEFEGTREGLGGLDADLDADWNGARLTATAELRGGFGDPVRARAALPVRPGAGGVPELSRSGPIDGAVQWAGDIGDLWALVPAPGHVLDGAVDVDLRVGGSVNAPRPSGQIALTEGEYQNLDAGTILTKLTATTMISEAGVMTVALDGSDGASGTVSVRTRLNIDGRALTPETDVTIDRAVLVRRDDVTAQVSGDLKLRGPVTNLALTGDITIDQAEVRLVGGTPPTVVDLEGIRVKGAPEEDGNGDGDGGVTLDLRVRADRDVFVRGRGLDSEWSIDLEVEGPASEPRVTGVIERVRGQLDLLGRGFDLARGKITFDGGRAIDPLVDVALEREDHGIRGGIYVDGRASAPELSFASQPALPEDEVMPRLLFGRSRQSLSGAEAVQLAAGIATLLSGRAGPLDFAREATGVDVLRIEGETTEEATVTVGKNIGENVFVGARQKLSGEGSAVAVEVEVFDNVVVDTELGQEGTGNVGITWRHDF